MTDREEQAIVVLNTLHDNPLLSDIHRQALEVGIMAIKALEQEPKTGRWEWVQYDGNPEIGNFHCSECRYIPAIFNMSAQKLNYCPKCGAKME